MNQWSNASINQRTSKFHWWQFVGSLIQFLVAALIHRFIASFSPLCVLLCWFSCHRSYPLLIRWCTSQLQPPTASASQNFPIGHWFLIASYIFLKLRPEIGGHYLVYIRIEWMESKLNQICLVKNTSCGPMTSMAIWQQPVPPIAHPGAQPSDTWLLQKLCKVLIQKCMCTEVKLEGLPWADRCCSAAIH